MKLIVGLGNPGKSYEKTRHNVGFRLVDMIASKNNVKIDKKKFNGLYAEVLINDEKVILLKPQSYMNLSGEVVKSFIKFFKIEIADILVISDDLDLPLGYYKLKTNSSSGGHNGLKNIEDHLKTIDYKRIKIGIGNDEDYEARDYVLSKFSKKEEKSFEQLSIVIMDIIDDYFTLTFDELMSKYNYKKADFYECIKGDN